MAEQAEKAFNIKPGEKTSSYREFGFSVMIPVVTQIHDCILKHHNASSNWMEAMDYFSWVITENEHPIFRRREFSVMNCQPTSILINMV